MKLEFGEWLGQGMEGNAWAATDELGRNLVVKFYKMLPDDQRKAAFDQARALAAVDHPAVVRVHALEDHRDPDTGDLLPCVVMSRVVGVTLEEALVSRDGNSEAARSWGVDIIDGIAAMHDANVYHGDIYAGNVVVSETRATIIDPLYRGSAGTGTRSRGRGEDTRRLVDVLRCLVDWSTDERSAGDFAHAAAKLSTHTVELRSLYESQFEARAATPTENAESLLLPATQSLDVGCRAYRWKQSQVCVEIHIRNATWPQWWVAVRKDEADALVNVSACSPGTPRTFGMFSISGPHDAEDGRVLFRATMPPLSPTTAAYVYLRYYPSYLELGKWGNGALVANRAFFDGLTVEPCP